MRQKRARRNPRKYAFLCVDLAKQAGVTAESLRRLVSRRKLDLTDLSVFLAFANERVGTLERQVAKAVLAAGGDMGKAAAALGCSRSTLYRRAKEGT